MLAILVLSLIGFLGFWGLRMVERELKTNLAHQLQMSLEATIKSVEGWMEERSMLVEVSASDPGVRREILSLIQKTNSKSKIDPEKIRRLPELRRLRVRLKRLTDKFGFIGFVVFDTTGLQIAALLEKPIGSRDLILRSDFVQRALKGHTVIALPFRSEIPLPDIHGYVKNDSPTMFAATPVYNDAGKVTAVLAFRLRPELDFTDLFSVSRSGASGETYAFNSDGQMISQSRFEPELRSMGLIPADIDSTSILSLEIRDPGGDLTKGFVPETPRNNQPMTLMAQSALQKGSGTQVDGYNDYRGVPVVGSWAWLESFNFGVTHEIDVQEALSPLRTLSQTFLILFGLLISAAGFGLTQYHRKLKAEEETEEKHQQTQELGRRMESIFQSTVDAIIVMDDEGIVESFNPGAEIIFGYTREEVIGKNVSMLMPEPYQSEHDGYLARYAETGEQFVLGQVRELIGLRKDGEPVYLELSANEMILDSGVKFTGTLRDISKRKQFEQKLLEAQQEAETASQAKTQFLSQMSHELRTPMNAILGFAQILESEPTARSNQILRDCSDHILKAGKHLMELINEILDLSRIETGEMSVSLEPVELNPLIQEVQDLSRPLADKLHITLTHHLSDGEAPVVWADRVRLRQVLLNLVSNAIKFNREKGSVTISCRPHGDGRLHISVTDTGLGIPKKKHNQLFEAFSRLHTERPNIEGTGIGLTIAQMLMGLMKGSIHVTSEVGKGSTFTLELPLSKEPAENIESQEDFPPNSAHKFTPALTSRSRRTVLYIEDNPANMFLIKQIMINHRPDLDLRTSPRGTTGLDLARDLQPDLILLDMNLPGMNGLDLFLHLQQSESTRDIPVVVVSANAMESDIERALSMGIDQYLTKPINIHKLLQVLDQYIKAPAAPDPLAPKKDNGQSEKLPSEKGRSSRGSTDS